MPYEEKDADYFFGRTRDTGVIVANLFASPLTLLYGPSGVGKTSVLNAGVVHALRGDEGAVVVTLRDWQGDPSDALDQAIRDAAGSDLPIEGKASLQTVAAGTVDRLERRLLVILDQFEEYFLYQPGGGRFEAELAETVTSVEGVGFLVSIRDDSLARLDRFESSIPELFENYLRVEHLDRAAAREAIERPLEAYAADTHDEFEIEPALVDAVLDQLEPGRGVVEGTLTADGASRIETPYLQLVMTRIWDAENESGSKMLRAATLRELGGAVDIVTTHLDEAMSVLSPAEQDVAAQSFRYLVTPSGTKIALGAADLAEWAQVPQKALVPVLKKLSDPRTLVLRSVSVGDRERRYEIFHDVLARPITDWRTRHEQHVARAQGEQDLATKYTVEFGVTFPELVSAKFDYDRELEQRGAVRPETEARYRAELQGFQSARGEITQSFWSPRHPSGTALTVKTVRVPFRRVERTAFHLTVDPRITVLPIVANLLEGCERLAVDAGELLRGTSERITMHSVQAVAGRLVASLDRPDDEWTEHVIQTEAEHLSAADGYFRRAASRAARLLYGAGMLAGLLVAVVLLAALSAILQATGTLDELSLRHGVSGAEVVAACIGGSIGTILSVQSRMRPDTTVDHEVGRTALVRLGAVRTLLGALLGLIAYFILKITLFKTDLFFRSEQIYVAALAGLVAGVAERLVPDIRVSRRPAGRLRRAFDDVMPLDR